MSYKRKDFDLVGFSKSDWQRHYHQHQTSYLRNRLKCVEHFASGLDFEAIATMLGVGHVLVRKSVNLYIKGSYGALLARVKRKQPTLLSSQQEAAFKTTLLHTHPTDHGIAANIWTGNVMIEYLKKTYNVCYKSGIYSLLYRLKLSHQRSHADYINADEQAQKTFVTTLKDVLCEEPLTTAIVFADEFSVCEKPTTYYGWAEKNTRPKLKTNEKKVNE